LSNNKFKINKHFEPIVRSNAHRFIICYGGAGSGKSYSIAQKIILSLLSQIKIKFLS